jgi:hypothetical protein
MRLFRRLHHPIVTLLGWSLIDLLILKLFKPCLHDACWLARVKFRGRCMQCMESWSGWTLKRVATYIMRLAWNVCACIPGTWLGRTNLHRVNLALRPWFLYQESSEGWWLVDRKVFRRMLSCRSPLTLLKEIISVNIGHYTQIISTKCWAIYFETRRYL